MSNGLQAIAFIDAAHQKSNIRILLENFQQWLFMHDSIRKAVHMAYTQGSLFNDLGRTDTETCGKDSDEMNERLTEEFENYKESKLLDVPETVEEFVRLQVSFNQMKVCFFISFFSFSIFG